jgi:hypothetical protein
MEARSRSLGQHYWRNAAARIAGVAPNAKNTVDFESRSRLGPNHYPTAFALVACGAGVAPRRRTLTVVRTASPDWS